MRNGGASLVNPAVPNQLPVSRGRDQKSSPQIGGTSTGCALAGPVTMNKVKRG
jgi:hypothetical protein